MAVLIYGHNHRKTFQNRSDLYEQLISFHSESDSQNLMGIELYTGFYYSNPKLHITHHKVIIFYQQQNRECSYNYRGKVLEKFL